MSWNFVWQSPLLQGRRSSTFGQIREKLLPLASILENGDFVKFLKVYKTCSKCLKMHAGIFLAWFRGLLTILGSIERQLSSLSPWQPSPKITWWQVFSETPLRNVLKFCVSIILAPRRTMFDFWTNSTKKMSLLAAILENDDFVEILKVHKACSKCLKTHTGMLLACYRGHVRPFSPKLSSLPPLANFFLQKQQLFRFLFFQNC